MLQLLQSVGIFWLRAGGLVDCVGREGGWEVGWAGVPRPQPCPTLAGSWRSVSRQDTIPAFPASDAQP